MATKWMFGSVSPEGVKWAVEEMEEACLKKLQKMNRFLDVVIPDERAFGTAFVRAAASVHALITAYLGTRSSDLQSRTWWISGFG